MYGYSLDGYGPSGYFRCVFQLFRVYGATAHFGSSNYGGRRRWSVNGNYRYVVSVNRGPPSTTTFGDYQVFDGRDPRFYRLFAPYERHEI